MGFGHELQHLLLLRAPFLPSWEQISSSLVLWRDGQQICTEVGSRVAGDEESRPSPLRTCLAGGSCQATWSEARARALGYGLEV